MVVSIVFCPFWCDTVSALAETPGVRALVRAAFEGRMAGAMRVRYLEAARRETADGLDDRTLARGVAVADHVRS